MKKAFVVLAVLCAGCSNNPTTTPSSTVTSPVSETFTSQIDAGGSAFRTFTALQAGNVTVTLVGGPAGLPVGLGLGLPDQVAGATTRPAGHCRLNTVINATAGAAVTTAVDAGSYCAGVFDIGGITAPNQIAFSIRIDHP